MRHSKGLRWLYHIVLEGTPIGDPYAPASLAKEGFIHASYRDEVRVSARLYFPAGARLRVLRIDPRSLAVPVEEAVTPRGPMPHVRGPVAAAAIVESIGIEEVMAGPDWITDQAGEVD